MSTELANAVMRAEAAEALLEELRQELETLCAENEELRKAAEAATGSQQGQAKADYDYYMEKMQAVDRFFRGEKWDGVAFHELMRIIEQDKGKMLDPYGKTRNRLEFLQFFAQKGIRP